MMEDELVALIEKTAKDAVFFQRIYPPQHSKTVNSYFGGQPRLPPSLEWPVQDAINIYGKSIRLALTFIAQVDLSEMPRSSSLAELPSQGTLYFFVNPRWAEGGITYEDERLGRVLFSPENTALYPTRVEHKLLIDCYGAETGTHYDWLQHIRSGAYEFPKSFAKWPIKGHIVRTYADTSPFSDPWGTNRHASEIWYDLRNEMQIQRLKDVFGPPVMINRFCEELPKERGQVIFPNSFPYNWHCVEIFMGFWLSEIYKLRERKLLPAELEPVAHSLEQEIKEWVAKARNTGRFNSLRDKDRTQLLTWCRNVIGAATGTTDDPRRWVLMIFSLEKAYREAPRLALAASPEAASTIPDTYLDAQRWQHCIHLTNGNHEDLLLDQVQHRLMGAYPIWSDSLGLTSDHVLLATFDSDEGMNWCWGDLGHVEFWIKKADLKARKFENAVVRFE